MPVQREPVPWTQHVLAGLLAGALGTAAMDYTLYLRYRRDGGDQSFWDWEFATGVTAWQQASAPGQLGQKAERLVLGHEPPETWARPTTNLVHWTTGLSWGLLHGTLSPLLQEHAIVRALGPGVFAWLTSYLLLPLAHVYRPIWEYDAPTLVDDLSAHLVYGTATSAVFAVLTRGQSR